MQSGFMRPSSLVVLAHVLIALSARAQEPRLIAADTSAVEAPYEFSEIGEVFALADGRVIVRDKMEQVVLLVDFRAGTSVAVGKIGDGPGEYRGAFKLIRLGGDSVGIIDAANPRILALTMHGTVGGFVSPNSKHPVSGSSLAAIRADGRGWLYSQRSKTRGSGNNATVTDSVDIFRWRPGTEPAELVGAFRNPPPEGAMVTATGHLVVRPGATPVLAPTPTWVVGDDGTIGIVNAVPFRVDFISPSGERSIGEVIPYAKVPVTEAIKESFRKAFARPQYAYIMDRATQTTTRAKMPPAPFRNENWAKELPAFLYDGFLGFAPDGTLWIQRTTIGTEGALYDLVGRDGRLRDRVRFPDGHRVVGFGRDAMYVVRRDANDLEYLQRRSLPR